MVFLAYQKIKVTELQGGKWSNDQIVKFEYDYEIIFTLGKVNGNDNVL